MKKNIPYLIAMAVCILITITATVAACSANRPLAKAPQDSTDANTATATETLTLPTHNSPTEATETITLPEATTAYIPEETTTEEITEEIVIEPEDNVTEEPPAIFETASAEEPTITEEPDEPEIIEPIISLEFLSQGNGTCSVTGIGNVTDTYIVIPERSPDGDVVTSIEEKAFYGNPSIRAIEIPSTVATIGDKAFADCPQLVYIAVDKANRLFTDVGGVLYSIDMTRLICYPSANGASSVTIPSTVTTISPMAFFGCENLKTVYYESTLECWSKINIGELNYGLYTASIICSDMGN